MVFVPWVALLALGLLVAGLAMFTIKATAASSAAADLLGYLGSAESGQGFPAYIKVGCWVGHWRLRGGAPQTVAPGVPRALRGLIISPSAPGMPCVPQASPCSALSLQAWKSSIYVTTGVAGACCALLVVVAAVRLVQRLRKAGRTSSSKGEWKQFQLCRDLVRLSPCCMPLLDYSAPLCIISPPPSSQPSAPQAPLATCCTNFGSSLPTLAW